MNTNVASTMTNRVSRRIGRLCLALLPLAAVGADAQPIPATIHTLSLDAALQRAAGESDEIAIARAGAARAEGNQKIARSQFFPQVQASLSYNRTLMSQFSGLTDAVPSDGDTSSAGPDFGSIFDNLSFGKENTWTLGVTAAQPLFMGGRLTAQQEAADARRASADVDLRSANAQLMLDVTQSYYDAILADQLVILADSSLAQTEEIFRQTELAFRVGARSEFEMLRARVTRDNQLPVLLQRRTDRSVAYFRLKQLLNIPLDDSLHLTSGVTEALPMFTQPSDTVVDDRAPVVQARENVRASAAGIDIAESERWPSVTLSSRFAPVAYPDGLIPSISDFRTDWTVGFNVAVPLFTGGRIGGNEQVAQGTLEEAEARLRQARKAATLDARVSMNEYAQAEATALATSSTVDQATRAYQIAQIRFREGIATQLEMTDARLQLEQSLANRARAVRNVQVARARLALLRDLPLGQGGAAFGAGAAAFGQDPSAFGQGAAGASGSMGMPQGAPVTGIPPEAGP